MKLLTSYLRGYWPLVVLALVLLNGLLAMSELAVVSSRRGKLKMMADAGHRGAAQALALNADPGRFLSTVQVGITLVGIVAGGLFVLPSLCVLIALSWIYLGFGQLPVVAGIFYGIKPAVTALVLHAAVRIGRRR